MSKSKNENPYRKESKYWNIFQYIRKHQVVTRQELIDQGFDIHSITVVLSPRAEGTSTRNGDCRGNMSAQGHVYFMDKLNRKKGENQKFRLRWRKEPIEKHVRVLKTEVPSKKVQKTEKAEKVEKTEKVEQAETTDI